MRPNTEFQLFGQQMAALESSAPELLLGGGGRHAGRSHALRVAGIYLCGAHAGLAVALVQRRAEDLRVNHLEGATALPSLLAEMHSHGAVTFNSTVTEARFANGSTLRWYGAERASEVNQLIAARLDVLLADDVHLLPEDLYDRLCRKALTSVHPRRRVIAASSEAESSWVGQRWGNGAADRAIIEFLSEQLDPSMVRGTTAVPEDYQAWLREMLPAHFTIDFAPYHHEYWRWLWAIRTAERPRPFVGIWSRDTGKSTSAEGGCVALGARGIRRYALYVRSTQDLADESVSNIGGMLESDPIGAHYPRLASRAVGKYGASRGWRRNRLRTASGFVVDGLGLDVAARGIKVDEQRPDLIVLDDIDHREDTDRKTAKKVRTLTRTILPTGTPHTAVLAIQNLIIPDGVFSQLAVKDRAEFLADRIVSGPHPAVHGMEIERLETDEGVRFRITGGRPSWEAKGLRAAEAQLNTFGPRAFGEEFQHELGDREGALWKSEDIRRRRSVLPDELERIAVGLDPSGGATEAGVIVAGVFPDGRGVVLEDNSTPKKSTPGVWARAAIDALQRWEGDAIVAEVNFGGDMVENTILMEGGAAIPVVVVRASRGKRQRAEPIAALYERGRIDHAGVFPVLEREMTRWVPGDPDSPNRLDALVWALTWLMVHAPGFYG